MRFSRHRHHGHHYGWNRGLTVGATTTITIATETQGSAPRFERPLIEPSREDTDFPVHRCVLSSRSVYGLGDRRPFSCLHGRPSRLIASYVSCERLSCFVEDLVQHHVSAQLMPFRA
jgi:hypothetical protein